MSTRVAPRRVAACLAAMLATFVSVPRADTWRALIVYTNEVDSVEGYQPLYERYLGIFDEINDLYDSSGMVGRAEIAGVIWDKEYVEE